MRRQDNWTVAEAMDAALMEHYCGNHKNANRILNLVLQYILREPNDGKETRPE